MEFSSAFTSAVCPKKKFCELYFIIFYDVFAFMVPCLSFFPFFVSIRRSILISVYFLLESARHSVLVILRRGSLSGLLSATDFV